MADAEREIKIVISGKNLTGPEFEKARMALAGVGKESVSGADQARKLQQQWQGLNGTAGTMWSTLKAGAGLIGVTFGAGAVVSFAGKVFSAAERIKDMSDRLDISAEAAQRFKYAAEQGGGSIDDVEKALATMNRTLATGDKSTIAALRSAGLEIDKVRQMKPEDAFRTIADAIGQIPDPMTRAFVAQELFGKSALRLLPAMAQGFSEVGKEAKVMSQESVERLEAAKQHWDNFLNDIIITTGNLVGELAKGNASYQKHVAELRTTIMLMSEADRAVARSAHDSESAWRQAFEQFDARHKDIHLAAQTTTDLTNEQAAATREAAAAAKKFREEQDRLFGRDKIEEAGALVRMVGSFPKAWQMTDAAQKQVLGTLREALDAYAKLGIDAPAAVRRLAQELEFLAKVQAGGNAGLQAAMAGAPTGRLIPGMTGVGPGGNAAVQGWAGAGLSLHPGMTGVGPGGNAGIQGWLQGQASTALAAPGRFLGMGAQAFGSQISSTMIQAFAGGGNPGVAVGGFIGQSIGQSIVEKSGAAITKSLGPMIGGAFSAAIPGIGALLGPLAGKLVGKVVDLFSGGEGAKANTLRDQLKARFGDAAGAGLQEAVSRFSGLAGIQEAYDRFMRGGSREQVQRAFDELTAKMDEAQAVLQKYGLSLDDLKSPQDRLASSTKTVTKEIDQLRGMGFSATQVSKAMAKELNDLVRASLEAGTKLPDTLQPYLQELAKGGLLADDLKARLLGLPEQTRAPWQEMQAIAEEYGIDLEALGPKFQQTKLGDTAEEFARKFLLLVDNGADADAVMDKMGAQAQTFLNQAKKWGLELPASMRPLLEKMLEQGRLTDENGQKLTSLEGIKFGQSAADQLDPLVQALNRLVDVFEHDLPGSIDELRARAGREIVIPVRVESQGGGSGAPDDDGDGFPNDQDQYPNDPGAYANGGVARRRQQAWVAERGPEIIGGEAFMDRVMDRVLARRWDLQAPASTTLSSQPVQVLVSVKLGDRSLDGHIVEVTAEAIALGRIPIPARVVKTQVPRG